jgi:hypothetical protein
MEKIKRRVEFPQESGENETKIMAKEDIPHLDDESRESIEPTDDTLKTTTNLDEQTDLRPATTLNKLRKSKLGKALQIATLLATTSAVGARYGSKLQVAGAEASETSAQVRWDKASPLEKFTFSPKKYLPEHFSRGDIDPRYTQIDILKSLITESSGTQKIILEQELHKFERQISQRSGWADTGRQNLLNSLIHNPAIRDQLTETTPTMADALSLLKATITDKGTGSYPDKLHRKIEQRTALEKTEFIGPHTDQVIIFNYASKDAGELFKGDQLVKMAQTALGEKAQKNPNNYISLISTEEVKDVTQATAGDALIKSIEQGRGNLALYLNTHASETELAIDLSDPKNPQTLKVEGLASALLSRLVNRVQQGETLSSLQTEIIIDGCEGYNLAQNTIEAMRKMYDEAYKPILHVNFEQLPGVTISTMAGEDSSVLAIENSFEGAKPSGSRALVDDDYLNLIKQEGGLTGKVLLKLQAEAYISGGDMTFFVPNQGNLEEISSFTQPKKGTFGTFEYGGKKLQYGSSDEDKKV